MNTKLNREPVLAVLRQHADDIVFSTQPGCENEMTLTLTGENGFEYGLDLMWPEDGTLSFSQTLADLGCQVYGRLSRYRERSITRRAEEAELDLRRQYADGNACTLRELLTAASNGSDPETVFRSVARLWKDMLRENKRAEQQALQDVRSVQRQMASLMVALLETADDVAVDKAAGNLWWNKRCLWNRHYAFEVSADRLADAAMLLEAAAADRSGFCQRDINRALAVVCREARRDNPAGLYQLGVLYDRGVYVPRDSSRAAEWYRRAAWMDHAQAQAALARMYAAGDGIARDTVRAEAWQAKSVQTEQLEEERKAADRDAQAMYAAECPGAQEGTDSR